MSGYMAVIAALPFLCFLANGHRIQFHALYDEKLEKTSSHSKSHPGPIKNSRISFESETKYIYNQSFVEVETKEEIQVTEKMLDTVESPTPETVNNDDSSISSSMMSSLLPPSTFAEVPSDAIVIQGDAQQKHDQSLAELDAHFVPLTGTTAEDQAGEDTLAGANGDAHLMPLSGSAAEDQSGEDALTAVNGDARFVPFTGGTAEDQSGDAKQRQPQSLAEIAASFIPLTATAAGDASTSDGMLAGTKAQGENSGAELETSVLTPYGQSVEQDSNDINKPVSDQLKPEEPSIESLIHTIDAEDLNGAHLGESGKGTQSESSPEPEQSFSSSTGSGADFDSVGVQQKGLGPELEAVIMPLISTASEPHAAAGEIKNSSGGSSRNGNSSGGEQHTIQERSFNLQKLENSSTLFNANVNAFSWDYFTSVPWPVCSTFVAVGLVTIILSLIRSCGFCLSKPLGCGFSISGTRQQHFHNGCMAYEWDQTMKEISIYLRPPEGQLPSDLEIKISSRHLQVGRKGRHCFLKEETYDVINAEMSSWSLHRSGELQIVLKKARRSKWPVALLHNRKMLGSPEMKSNALNSNLKPIEVK